MEFFNLISVEEAQDRLLENFKDYHLETEEVHILDCINRVLAEDSIQYKRTRI